MAVKEKAWSIKRNQVMQDAQERISSYNAQIARLSDSVRAAEVSYNAVSNIFAHLISDHTDIRYWTTGY